MPGVLKELVEYALNLDPSARPVRQPLHHFAEPKCKAIAKELHRLEESIFIREIKQSTWVANPILVQKKHICPLHVRRFHRTQQALSKGSLPAPMNRQNHRINDMMQASFLFRCSF
jgi:hypothetical protein